MTWNSQTFMSSCVHRNIIAWNLHHDICNLSIYNPLVTNAGPPLPGKRRGETSASPWRWGLYKGVPCPTMPRKLVQSMLTWTDCRVCVECWGIKGLAFGKLCSETHMDWVLMFNNGNCLPKIVVDKSPPMNHVMTCFALFAVLSLGLTPGVATISAV